jgi:hypothetical protein
MPSRAADRSVIVALLELNNETRAIQRELATVTKEMHIAARLTQPTVSRIGSGFALASAVFARAVLEHRLRYLRERAARAGAHDAVGKLAGAGPATESAARTAVREAAERLIARVPYRQQIADTIGPRGFERILVYMNTFDRPLPGQSRRFAGPVKGAVTQAFAQGTPQGAAAARELLQRADDARLLLPQPDLWIVHHEVGEVFGPAFADKARAAKQLALTSRLTVKGSTRGLHLSPIKEQPLQWFDESVWLVYPLAGEPIALFTGGLEYKGLANAAELAAQFGTGIGRLGLGRVRLSIGDARTLLVTALVPPKLFGAFPTGGAYAAPDLARVGAQMGLAIDPIPLGPVNGYLWGLTNFLCSEWEKPAARSLIPALVSAGR